MNATTTTKIVEATIAVQPLAAQKIDATVTTIVIVSADVDETATMTIAIVGTTTVAARKRRTRVALARCRRSRNPSQIRAQSTPAMAIRRATLGLSVP